MADYTDIVTKSNNGYRIKKGDGGETVSIKKQPTLDSLRETSKSISDPLERIDLLELGLSCSFCNASISDRFSADSNSNILCWECATNAGSTEQTDISTTTDPAKVVLGESGLNHKSLCDYVINVATGCTHGCKFCYVPSTPNITARQDMLSEQANVEDGQREWGSYLLYRDDLPERLSRKLNRKRKWKRTRRGRGIVMLSSGTDCYQNRRAAQITRGCMIELVKQGIPVRILTRSPAVCRDLDLFEKATEMSANKDGQLIRIGSSIPCLDDEKVRAIEPGAPPPSARLRALETLSAKGIPVYVSMSPTYPTQKKEDFKRLLRKFAKLDPKVVFHEPMNPRGDNFSMTIEAARQADQTELAAKLEKLKNKEYWIKYSLQQMNWVEELGDELGVDVHVWPDKKVINSIDSDSKERWSNQLNKVSPENIPSIPIRT